MIFKKSGVELDGSLSVVTRDASGKVTNEIYVPNLVVVVGKQYIASRMIDNSAAVMEFMALGTDDSLSSDDTVTALQAEVALSGYSRVQASVNQVGTDSNQVEYVATFAPGNPGSDAALVEAGIFDATTSGNMLCRTTFPIVTKQAGDTITITWTITIN